MRIVVVFCCSTTNNGRDAKQGRVWKEIRDDDSFKNTGFGWTPRPNFIVTILGGNLKRPTSNKRVTCLLLLVHSPAGGGARSIR